jgi:hypothetical protein
MLGDARRRRQPGPFRDHSSTAQARVHGGALALSGLAAELAAAPAPDSRVVRPAVRSLLKGNLCLAGALLKIRRPQGARLRLKRG